jgi:hypothetical protein
MEFKLLEKNVKDIKLENVKSIIEESNMFNEYRPYNDESGLFYYDANTALRSWMTSYLPPSLREYAEISVCKIINGVLPHKDHDCSSKINYYLKSGNAKTVFFEDPQISGYSYHHDEKMHMYDIKKNRLKRLSEFTADEGDIFLLNTSKIHAVFMNQADIRIIVSASFNLSFEKVLNLL